MIVREEVACHVVVDVLRKHGKRAHEVLVAGLEKAKATGGKKVTAKALVQVAEIVEEVDFDRMAY
jgi:hypothetical protein